MVRGRHTHPGVATRLGRSEVLPAHVARSLQVEAPTIAKTTKFDECIDTPMPRIDSIDSTRVGKKKENDILEC